MKIGTAAVTARRATQLTKNLHESMKLFQRMKSIAKTTGDLRELDRALLHRKEAG